MNDSGVLGRVLLTIGYPMCIFGDASGSVIRRRASRDNIVLDVFRVGDVQAFVAISPRGAITYHDSLCDAMCEASLICASRIFSKTNKSHYRDHVS